MKKITFITGLILCLSASIFAQMTVPRTSQKSMISQTVGDTNVEIVYHRPNAKGRTIFAAKQTGAEVLVPYGEVWRTGANNATTFEITNDAMINGKPLPAGKYSVYTIPNQNEWTIIFNKTWDQWGTVYEENKDALRVTAKPTAGNYEETMSFEFDNVTDNTTQMVIAWDKVRVPITVDVGNVSERILKNARSQMNNTRYSAARYIVDSKLKDNYSEALDWLNDLAATGENYGVHYYKAMLLAEMGKRKEAIAAGEKALEIGKKAKANTGSLEKMLDEWKSMGSK